MTLTKGPRNVEMCIGYRIKHWIVLKEDRISKTADEQSNLAMNSKKDEKLKILSKLSITFNFLPK